MRTFRVYLFTALLLILGTSAVFAQEALPSAPATSVSTPSVPDTDTPNSGEVDQDSGKKSEKESTTISLSTVQRFAKKMPDIPYFDEKAFSEKTKLYKKRPMGDDSLAYKIFIPSDWEQGEEKSSSNFVISDKLFLELNVFYGPARIAGRSKLEISAVSMDLDLTAEQWYLKYILESGFTLEGFSIFNDRKVESLMIITEDDASYYVRTVACINGKRMVLARYFLPTAYWQDEAPMQASVMRTFEMTKQIEEVLGKYDKFQFLDVAELQYPISWKVHAPALRSVEKMQAKILNIRNTSVFSGGSGSSSDKDAASDGQVDIALVSSSSGSSLIAEIGEYKKALEGTGILVGKKLPYEITFDYHNSAIFALSEVYEGIDSSSDFINYELWFTVMVAGNYYYFITLLTPSREDNFVAWAKNIQGYKKIVSSFTPVAGAFLERD